MKMKQAMRRSDNWLVEVGNHPFVKGWCAGWATAAITFVLLRWIGG